MNSEYLSARLAGTHRAKARSDKWLKLLVFLMLAGYAFFFLSRFFFPKIYKAADVTSIGTVVDLGDYTLTLDAWDYAPRQRAFEIVFDMQNLSLDRQPQLSFVCRNGGQIYRSEIYRTTSDLLVVRVRGVSDRWAQVSLTVKTDGANARLRMDDRSVTRVDALAEKTDAEYAIYAAQNKIRAAETELDALAEEGEKLRADITYTNQQLTELVKKEKTQVGSELEQTQDGIRHLGETQGRLQNELEELALREKELQERIESQRRTLEALGGGGT